MRQSDTGQAAWLTPQEQMKLVFGTTTPRIAEFPHLIFSVEAPALQIVVEKIEEPGGIVGHWQPRFDANGEYFILPDEEEEYNQQLIDNFLLYALPQNHHQIQEWCFWVDSTPIAWMIPAMTSVDVLQSIYSPNDDFEDYYYHVDRLADWLEDIPWVVARLEHEGKWALVALEAGATARLERIRSAWSNKALSPFNLRSARTPGLGRGPCAKP